ncbi:carbohydrate ABC transporter permease [Paraburkholderia sp. Ac-20336]|uniref:carbohydrate ABC transporter permease n=1 Tax=unclassified Paraburkholderia TaxID=2615204 RepID=UPI00141F20F1|nr:MULTISPECIES: carbohydrate ABC transporter permease [unclassified Paraburkholderia]MBN3802825.1 carbohydrate ABC transporter permease [Paraburkholderia sp. Ac-20336]NIF79605.1 carbohydrate ABC transporter permease [Paraburkholderia sp. Cy-641]
MQVRIKALMGRPSLNESPAARRVREHSPVSLVLVYGVLCLHAVLTLFPLIWVIGNSFRSSNSILTSISLLPRHLDFSNYERLFTSTNIPLSFWNSVSITAVSLGLLLVVVVPLSFALTRFKFKFAEYILLFFTVAVLVPNVSVLPMTYVLFTKLGLMGTKYGIALVYATEQIPVSIFILTGFMRAIPAEIDEAATVDGASVWALFSRVILPLSRNGIATIMILAFVSIWNDYMTALLLLPDAENRTLSVALAFAKTEYSVDYGMMAASIVFAVAPMVVGYLLLKKQLTTGITAGAVKG